MAESKEELKSLLMKMIKESEKAGLKFKSQKTEIKTAGRNINNFIYEDDTTLMAESEK